MSTVVRDKRKTVKDIIKRKGAEPIVTLTAYSAPMAALLDKHVDVLLVGDSLGMALYGMNNTLGVTLDMMIQHGKAVMRGSKTACVIIDMPFGSYQESPQLAYRNAARILAETGCAGVKIEGGEEMAETVEFLTARGIPVMGHIGLKPQSVNITGGFFAQGKEDSEAKQIMKDAKAISNAGAFAIVIESTKEQLAKDITSAISAPTIGIGASPQCDGQVLVTEDVIGLMPDFKPKFVKRYAELGHAIEEIAAEYAAQVKSREFPAAENCFQPTFD